ncbi:YveK family protein [Dehalobacter restrictus]|uniref:Lipopolysaccharide biosynthesis protein n=1 Tax=Dehalobacter restrictus TaxID=55583 RepID=A0A857DKA3_9FIRM|nr:Wzz/FepE/Etk N-terminal domain-containing protein [Dehalobacter restrictus]QHA00932.1 lipopolysaccharide biosynthesis protein [Dehalobacter restrictus]
MEIRRIIDSISRKWWLCVVSAVLFGGMGWFFHIFLSSPTYNADTTLYVLNRDRVTAGESLSYSDITMGKEFLKQYSGIFYSRSVAAEAARKLDQYSLSAGTISSMANLSINEDSGLLKIRVTAYDAMMAASVADVMGEVFSSKVKEITNSDFIGILDKAQVSNTPIPDNGIIKMILWIVAGEVFSLGIIYLLEYFDTTIRSVEDIENNIGVRVIGIIPEHDLQ